MQNIFKRMLCKHSYNWKYICMTDGGMRKNVFIVLQKVWEEKICKHLIEYLAPRDKGRKKEI